MREREIETLLSLWFPMPAFLKLGEMLCPKERNPEKDLRNSQRRSGEENPGAAEGEVQEGSWVPAGNWARLEHVRSF